MTVVDITEKVACWYCDGEMYFRIYTTCFGETTEFFECAKCHFTLNKDFIEKYGPHQPAA